MKRKVISTKEDYEAYRRDLISRALAIGARAALGLQAPDDHIVRPRLIRQIRWVERAFGFSRWDERAALAKVDPATVVSRKSLALPAVPLHRPSAGFRPKPARGTIVNVGPPGQPMPLSVKGDRLPLVAFLEREAVTLGDFRFSIGAADLAGDSAGHAIDAALMTTSGQLSTAVLPAGGDAYLIFCRNCHRAAWFDPPAGLDPATIARARVFQLGGVCAGPRPPKPPAAAAETHCDRGPNRSGRPAT